MNTKITDTTNKIETEYIANEQFTGYSPEEWFDELDKRLIAHFGEDFRNKVNESRKKWNQKGWNFDML